MRLICPNCGAQYEVADDVIPKDGRDVQCSNCAHTWFESRETSNVEDVLSEEVVAPDSTLAAEGKAVKEAKAEVEAVKEDAAEDDDEVWGAEAYAPKPAPAPAVKPQPQRQELDSSIADILREEAAREAAARRAEAEYEMENQPDLGLDSANAAPDQRSAEAQKRMALLKGESSNAAAVAATVAATVAASRRELLPDIEDINSSLRSEAERGTGYAEVEVVQAKQKRGFRTGFLSVMTLLAVLAAIYLFASQLSAKFPAAEGALKAYVASVDSGRLWLNGKLEDLLASLTDNEIAASEPVLDAQPETAPAVTTEAPALPSVDQ